MAWKKRKGFLHLFLCFTGGGRFVEQVTKKVVVGWSDAVWASRLRKKSVPFASVILHPRHS
jgi:hypothetical protein